MGLAAIDSPYKYSKIYSLQTPLDCPMHTVELLAHALDLGPSAGFAVRQEWLGAGGGNCVLKGRKLLFLDLAAAPDEQLEQVLDALRHDPQALASPMPPPLQERLACHKAA